MSNNYEAVVNATLEKYLAKNKRITAPDLYELVKGKLEPSIELADFRLWSSKFFKQSPTYVSVKGRFGGIRLRMTDDPKPAPVEEIKLPEPKPKRQAIPKGSLCNVESETEGDENEEESAETARRSLASESSSENASDDFAPATVMLNATTRIHATDSRNWTLQKLTGDTWMSKAYYSTMEEALKGAARKILNKELRIVLDKPAQLKELSETLAGIEKKLVDIIRERSI